MLTRVIIIPSQLIFRVGLLVALHNPAHGQWCREFCCCIVNYEVGRKYRERFMVDDDWEAKFTNTWSQMLLVLLVGWPLFIIQPDWGIIFFERFTTTDDDTLYAFRDRLRRCVCLSVC